MFFFTLFYSSGKDSCYPRMLGIPLCEKPGSMHVNVMLTIRLDRNRKRGLSSSEAIRKLYKEGMLSIVWFERKNEGQCDKLQP